MSIDSKVDDGTRYLLFERNLYQRIYGNLSDEELLSERCDEPFIEYNPFTNIVNYDKDLEIQDYFDTNPFTEDWTTDIIPRFNIICAPIHKLFDSYSVKKLSLDDMKDKCFEKLTNEEFKNLYPNCPIDIQDNTYIIYKSSNGWIGCNIGCFKQR